MTRAKQYFAVHADPNLRPAISNTHRIIAFRNRLIRGYATVADVSGPGGYTQYPESFLPNFSSLPTLARSALREQP